MKKNPNKALWLSFIPGLGQYYNGQKLKAGIFLGAFAIFVVEMIFFGWLALTGLITLGTVPMRDHSMFLMVKGTLQLLILVIFILF